MRFLSGEVRVAMKCAFLLDSFFGARIGWEICSGPAGTRVGEWP